MGSNSVAALFLFLAAVPSILAVTFQVGDTAGWNSGVDYTTWASGKTFRVGDTLEFQYDPSHSVSVVDKAGFDSCDSSGETQSFSGGDTKIDLTTVGTMHFFCPSPGHCLGGMKLAVPVLPTASSPATPSPPSSSTPSPSFSPRSPRKPKIPPPTASPPANGTPDLESLTPSPSPSTPSLSPSTPSPSPSLPNAASKGVISYGVIGMTMVLMFGVMS
ncbi:PREDICTED: uclacyanin-3-like [Camelina sativa]|uniref:Uclacyanin-3-like n=1 Tax=Camelina sativa TaxID=90675 RepID=A0ABM0ZGK5_CAMSA|nr:PREDICTED: uclacyanin-3-like [Camelina sativa]